MVSVEDEAIKLVHKRITAEKITHSRSADSGSIGQARHSKPQQTEATEH